MSKFWTAICLCLTGLAINSGVAKEADRSSRFVQEQFAIGLFIDPIRDGQWERQYREIAEAHFNLMVCAAGGPNNEVRKKQLALCEKNGLKALLWRHNGSFGVGDVVREDAQSPAYLGSFIRDEPNLSEFPELRKRVDRVRQIQPGKLGLINLFPDYASEQQLGTTYEKYVSEFMGIVSPDVLAMDYYPVFHPDRSDSRSGYIRCVGVIREAALKAGIPFWHFIYTVPFGQNTDPTEGQLRWQIYTAVTLGAKGIFWFCYYTPEGPDFEKGGAILEDSGRLTRHYGQAMRLNRELKMLGPVLMNLTSTGFYQLGPKNFKRAGKVLAGTPVKNISKSQTHDPAIESLVGVYRHRDGRRAVMIQNNYWAYTTWLTVEFQGDLSQVTEIDKKTGREIPVIDDSRMLPGIQLSLDAGEGRLFLIQDGQK